VRTRAGADNCRKVLDFWRVLTKLQGMDQLISSLDTALTDYFRMHHSGGVCAIDAQRRR
jgi:hypothetical protein